MMSEPPSELADLLDGLLLRAEGAADLLDDAALLLEGLLLMPALVLAGCLMWVGETLEALGHWLAEFVDEGGGECITKTCMKTSAES